MAGLRALAQLLEKFPESYDRGAVDLIACLACYTDSEEVWTWTGCEEIARGLLGAAVQHFQVSPAGVQETYVLAVLSRFVRPIFARSKPRGVTSAGRRAVNPLPSSPSLTEDGPQLQPWKHEKFFVVSVLHWLLEQLNVGFFKMCYLS